VRFFGSAARQKPSIGASMASAPIAESISGKVKKPMSSCSASSSESVRKSPR
jgi:hypothetical protein